MVAGALGGRVRCVGGAYGVWGNGEGGAGVGLGVAAVSSWSSCGRMLTDLCWAWRGGCQFLVELRAYGLFLGHQRASGDKDDKAARDYFFSSLTGAVVYGHGRAKWVSPAVRKAVSLLADTLYMTVTFQVRLGREGFEKRKREGCLQRIA